LDFSKLEAGKVCLDPHPFNLRDSLEGAMKALALRAHQKGLELLCRVDPSVPEIVVADSFRLRQVVVNLVGNALKFTDLGHVLLQVTLASTCEGSRELEFTVADTGMGIAVEKQAMIFDSFTQVDGSATRRFGGTGLGLSISQQLVKMMGGSMGVESVPGDGATFRFRIQFDLAGELPVLPGSSGMKELNVSALRGLRALIVDDNAINCRILEELLLRWEMLPVVIRDPCQALALLEQERQSGPHFAVMLLDAQMPGMDGFTLARRIKENPALAGAAILMLSSNDLTGDAKLCREIGVDLYLVKPIAQGELCRGILSVLQAAACSQTPAEREILVRTPRPRTEPAARRLRVLLVEDNPVNQRLAQKLLEKRGHRVTLARHGREAVDAYARQSFDAVLMDLQMPGMGGFEATALIREQERMWGGYTPIIAVTAHAMAGDRDRCLAAGMDDYVSKPIDPALLFEKLENLAVAA